MTANSTINAHGAAAQSTPWGARQWALLCILSGNMLLDAVEVSVVLVALPTIGDAVGMPLLAVQCLMSGFALGFAALLLLGNRITAWCGRRRAYLGAMAVFALASVVGGMTDSELLLIATRVVKGCCAALTAPTGLAIISTAFRDGPQQRKAVSVYSLFGATGFTGGLLLSAALLASSWRWTLFFPAPVALALLICALRIIPHDPDGRPPRLKPALLRDARLLRSAIGAATLNGTYVGLLLQVTFQLQQRLGWSPWQCALALLPACAPLMVAAPFAGRLVARWGTGRLIALGALAPFAGCAFYLWRAPADSYWAAVLPALLLVETGFVLAFAALNMQATATIRPEQRGSAVPLYQTGVQLGGVLMLPLVALLLTVGHGYRPALLLITVVSAVGLLTALTGLTGPAPLRPEAAEKRARG
ncbi:MFS transporter [Streptomyces pinistramenti]|uniref:MFS transporter n=1 Tax=Streptomyces pinistramenti TaxID=2884812 RepID=UPI001D08F243|nr:MFS transporter [Streptomyces pinistramenti]MCB5909988.1 MFS transporter [Streptomyces pinistramenti]